jgi:hypothetical protein
MSGRISALGGGQAPRFAFNELNLHREESGVKVSKGKGISGKEMIWQFW